MNFFMFLYMFVLFFLLTPGILVTLPPKGSVMVVAATHALVFSLLFCITNKTVGKLTSSAPEGVNLKRDFTSTKKQIQTPKKK